MRDVTNLTQPASWPPQAPEKQRALAGEPEMYWTTTFRTTREHFSREESLGVIERVHLTEAEAEQAALELWNGDYPGLRYFHSTRYEWVGPGRYEARVVNFAHDWTFPQRAAGG